MSDTNVEPLAFDDDASDDYSVAIKHTHIDTNGKSGTHTHAFKWGEYAAHAIEYSVAHPKPDDYGTRDNPTTN